MIEVDTDQVGQRQRIDHQLFDGLFPARTQFVIENVDQAVADLHDLDIAGNNFIAREAQGNVVTLPQQLNAVGRRSMHTWQSHCNGHIFVSCGQVEGLLWTSTGTSGPLAPLRRRNHRAR